MKDKNQFKSIVYTIAIIAFLYITYLYVESGRYEITNTNNGYSYKIDNWTGNTWILIDGEQYSIIENGQRKRTIDGEPVEIVKTSYNLSGTHKLSHRDNHSVIRSELERLDGSLEVLGWSHQAVNEHTHLVKFEYLNNNRLIGHYFDVNMSESIVRYINDDPRLLNDYRQDIEGYSSLMYLHNALKEQDDLTGIPDFKRFQSKLSEDVERRKKFFEAIEKYSFVPSEFEEFDALYFSEK